ncbi:MAG: hypothetical protein M1495_00960 [Bacteroidetes bacterium]|nr:hypothetical protein [Bacteroidota bacterium]MCL6099747.1 hypothetical protein [Bacteroidota bacterium]
MKQLLRTFTLAVTLSIVTALFPGRISAQQYDVNFQVFYNQLSPYGQWIENPNYGYVWIPDAGPDFAPYLTNGYWLLTEYGWTWVSDYDWGWATFHYGRWDYNGYYGWFWVPDNQWGPSWVTWRWSAGYYGWAPMRPGVSINITFGRNNDVPYDRWVFVRDRDIERHDIGRNYMDRRNNIKIFNNSKVIKKTYYDDKRRTTYVAGPGREDVQKYIGRAINPVVIHDRNAPGQSVSNDQLQIYRPQVQRNSGGEKPAPSKITNVRDLRKISDRKAETQPQNREFQNNNAAKGQQQPAVNLPNKINSRENPPQQQNVNSRKDKINNGRQPEANPIKKIDNKTNAYQPQRLDPPKKENNKNKSPQQFRDANPPNNNSTKDIPRQQRNLDPPKMENMTDRPLQPQNINMSRDNKGKDQTLKVRTINPPKKNVPDQPDKSNANDNKKEDKQSK